MGEFLHWPTNALIVLGVFLVIDAGFLYLGWRHERRKEDIRNQQWLQARQDEITLTQEVEDYLKSGE